MLLHWIANLADQNIKQQLKINMRVTYHTFSLWNEHLIDTCQHCSASRANQALRSLANAGFQNRGVCLQAFPSFPSPSPHFHFFGSCFIYRAAKTENLSLLRNQTETLATQASEARAVDFFTFSAAKASEREANYQNRKWEAKDFEKVYAGACVTPSQAAAALRIEEDHCTAYIAVVHQSL